MQYSRQDVLDKAISYLRARKEQVDKSNDASMAAEVLGHNLSRIIYDIEAMKRS